MPLKDVIIALSDKMTRHDELQQENRDLQDQLDAIADIVSPGEEEEEEEEDDDEAG